ncbi:DUF1206 domain-containing protein [Rhodobacter sp. NTK016B]|uniref:DUF1206 domain-containing protein n=1 Tax=Rhodobacter sp. NTK016B TaxID=2759676 RepID=UPI001A8CEF75|nr:DUF1206 domain-containing protein [Rhodobacter sp. NTK016B]MBN8290825.1 DUF1206 domain-containing protein [Rhodobacter sp. NTK016B]
MTDQRAPDWVVPMMRAGYSSRGIVYLILGALSLTAAATGGRAEGTQGAVQTLREAPFGQVLLWLVAIGFLCYGIWRLIAAYYDLEQRGDDEEGHAKRFGLVVTGLIHIGIGGAIATFPLSIGAGSGGGSGGASDWTATIMQMPAGRWLVSVGALCIIGAGVHYVLKGWQKKYQRYIQSTETTQKLQPLLRWGFVSYGIVLGIAGAFLLYAAISTDPSEAKGIGGALEYIHSLTAGRILLGVIGLGILGFGVENLVEARYRVVPGVSGSRRLTTIAQHVRAQAERAT